MHDKKIKGPICPYSGDSFRDMKELRAHILDEHRHGEHTDFTDSGKLVVECQQCGHSFVSATTHPDRRVKRNICPNCESDIFDR